MEQLYHIKRSAAFIKDKGIFPIPMSSNPSLKTLLPLQYLQQKRCTKPFGKFTEKIKMFEGLHNEYCRKLLKSMAIATDIMTLGGT